MKNLLWIILSVVSLGFCGVASAQNQPIPECKSPESRQFDFWVGEWDILKNGTTEIAGKSSVQLILGNCVVFENYTNKAFAGKSFNIYTEGLKKWQQFWVDNTGGVIEFVGELKNQEMSFTGESYDPKGGKILQRMKFTPMPEGKVRQLLEQSKDNGKTWTVAYDGIYVKKK
jgi:hypothetical protein